MASKAYKFEYKPAGEVISKFLRSDKKFRGIRGPVGSGKSVTCCVEILRRGLQQAPDKNGIRRSRWAVVRNTNPQLKTTTIKTWQAWFPEEHWGPFRWDPPYTHRIKRDDLDLEVIFLALDQPKDVRKLLSMDLTGVWVNEAREVPKSIIDACTMRTGRYPETDGEYGPTWYGVIADTNPPEDDHWWPIMSGDVPMPDYLTEEDRLTLIKPDSWEFFAQPPGMIKEYDGKKLKGYVVNKDAENLSHLPDEYYPEIIKGKSEKWISVYVMNQYGSIEEGKAVYPSFRRQTHVAESPIEFDPDHPLIVGMDFGLSPAAVFAQHIRDRWFILKEIAPMNMTTATFARIVNQYIDQAYPDAGEVRFHGDPTGDSRSANSSGQNSQAQSAYLIMRGEGIIVRPSPTNDPVIRVETVSQVIGRMVDGLPALQVDPGCKLLIKGFESGYMYRRVGVAGEPRYEEKPTKNKYSHPHDATQYLMLGEGEGRNLIATSKNQSIQQVHNARSHWDVFESQKRKRNSSRGRSWN